MICDHSDHKFARIAFVLIDGVGDVNIPTLKQQTPLQYAPTPVLDAVARKS